MSGIFFIILIQDMGYRLGHRAESKGHGEEWGRGHGAWRIGQSVDMRYP